MLASITYFQAIVMGLVQGLTELFPISSLGHGILVPAWLGWTNLVNSQSQSESFFLAFIVGLHVGTAVGLIIYYRKTWGALFSRNHALTALIAASCWGDQLMRPPSQLPSTSLQHGR